MVRKGDSCPSVPSSITRFRGWGLVQTHKHTHIYIHICIYIVSVWGLEREHIGYGGMLKRDKRLEMFVYVLTKIEGEVQQEITPTHTPTFIYIYIQIYFMMRECE